MTVLPELEVPFKKMLFPDFIYHLPGFVILASYIVSIHLYYWVTPSPSVPTLTYNERMLLYTRCQGAIIRDHQILLITHQERDTGRSYWVIPGGGLESGETPEQCTRREMQEETGLEVQVNRLLFPAEENRGSMQWHKLT